MNWQQLSLFDNNMFGENNLPIFQILKEYIDIVIPAMYKQRYHLKLAKGGPDYPYLAEQSFLGHILNGVFGLIEIVKFIAKHKIFVYGLNESMLRKALALYTIHDLHKFNDYEKIGSSEFAIPLERLQNEYQKLNISQFAGEIDAHIMRAVNVSKRSKKQGDLILSQEENSSKLWVLVRIADAIASATSPSEIASSLQYYLGDCLAPEFKTKYKLYTHDIQDIRGFLTTQIHGAVKAYLVNQFGFQDIAYFATGTVYLGPKKIDYISKNKIIQNLVEDILNGLNPSQEMVKSAATDGLRREKYDFQHYIYTFTNVETSLEIVLEETRRTKPKINELKNEIDKIIKRATWKESFDNRFEIKMNESKGFQERWILVRRYLLYVDNLLKLLAPNQERLTWYAETFNLSSSVLSNFQEAQSIFAIGGLGKYVNIPAYHFLKGQDFTNRSAEAQDVTDVLHALHNRTIDALKKINSHLESGRKTLINNLGFRPDLTNYLNEQLIISFASDNSLTDDALSAYVVQKKKGHSDKFCSICNRPSEYVQELRTDILGDFGRVFSFRVLPAQESPGKNRPWCPVCHLEFILRKLKGLSLPSSADYTKSRRIHIYVLPTFSFTSEYARYLDRMLPTQLSYITALPIRDYGEESPGLPRLWLERGELDPEWLEMAIEVFNREAERIAKKPGYVGERLLLAQNTSQRDPEEEVNQSNSSQDHKPEPQPNYYLIPWEHSVREGNKDDANVPTRTEAWAKATFAAVVISSLTSSRVFVTEQPYLSVSNPSDLKTTVTLDSPPAIIAKLLGNDRDPKLADRADTISLYGIEIANKSGLERALDLCSALWMITSAVHRPKSSTKDKQIAERLEEVAVNPMAGSHFYKEYSRLNDDASPFPVLAKACEILLEYFGVELMELVTRITEKALEIRLPYREYGRGKAHNYELVFREAVDAMRSAFRLLPELRQTALTGKFPSDETLTELKQQAAGTLLKAMERRQITRRGDGIINPYKKDLGQLIGEFIDLVVDEVFLNRADRSFSQFLRLENSLADGVYYCTDRLISEKWKIYNEAKSQKKGRSDNQASI